MAPRARRRVAAKGKKTASKRRRKRLSVSEKEIQRREKAIMDAEWMSGEEMHLG